MISCCWTRETEKHYPRQAFECSQKHISLQQNPLSISILFCQMHQILSPYMSPNHPNQTKYENSASQRLTQSECSPFCQTDEAVSSQTTNLIFQHVAYIKLYKTKIKLMLHAFHIGNKETRTIIRCNLN